MKKIFLAILFSLAICVFGITNNVYASTLNNNTQNQFNYFNNPTVEFANANEMEIQTNYTNNVDQKVIDNIIKESKRIHENPNLQQNIITPYVTDPPGGGMNVGAAWPYVHIGFTTSVNCYGYALGITAYLNPGSIAWRNNGIAVGTPVDMIADAVIQDLHALGRYGRIISSASDFVTSNEYRIALRTGSYNSPSSSSWDYHFMLQTSSGGWCDKHGPQETEYLGLVNPSTISWPKDNFTNYYTSETIYLAITK